MTHVCDVFDSRVYHQVLKDSQERAVSVSCNVRRSVGPTDKNSKRGKLFLVLGFLFGSLWYLRGSLFLAIG